jgi:MFS family permease
MALINNFYAWLFCAFAALGACLYGYDGVYFTGVSAMDIFAEHFGSKQTDGAYAISASDLSIMTSVINIGELVGSLTAAPLNDFLGRKGVFLIASITIIIGVILQIAADYQQSFLIGGRILLGYGVGNFSATSPLYMGVSREREKIHQSARPNPE